jgi:hypothetical protein
MRRSTLFFAFVCAAAASTEAEGSSSNPGFNNAKILTGSEGVCVRTWHLAPFKPTPDKRVVRQAADVKCEQGCVLELEGGNQIKLSPGAAVMVGPYYFVPINEQKKIILSQQIEVLEGDVEATAPNPKGYGITLVSNGSMVAFRNGRVHLVAQPDHAAVAVVDGAARANSGKVWADVPPGQVVRLDGREKPTVTHPVPKSPAWTHPQLCPSALSIVEEGGTTHVGGCWTATAGAMSYRIEIAKDPEFKSMLDEVRTQSSQFVTPPLPVGYYFARVRGLDPDGIEGPASTVRHLGVVPVQLPAGSLADLANHALIVPAHAQISFGEPGPLEIAEGNGGYIQVPPALTVDERAEHVLRLRLKGDQSSESELRIEKRELRAEVELTPHLPRWPKDPIDLYVNIEDPTGKMSASAIQPRIEVLIGTHEVPIDWTHSGTIWAARLEPRHTYGPSVVRVIVRDQNGHLLGRNFVEVEGIPLPPSNELTGGTVRQVAQN